MIKLTKDFFKIVDEFNDYICSDIDKSTIFNNRVEERFVNVLDVQSKCFDEQLNNINAILNCDFTDINNLPKISSVLKSLHKCIARDRLNLIDLLMRLT